VPLLLAVSGARQVVTVDINPWLSHQTAVNTTREMASRAQQLADPLGISEETIRARLQAALSAPTLEAWQSALGIRYIQASLVAANLPATSIDVVFSSNVLEHVVPEALDEMHRESARVLRRGGRIVHRFNPQDHFSAADRSITGANFLQFSERQWYWLGGSGLAFHNRLRCPQHQVRIAQAGFDVVLTRTRPDARARLAIESGALRVHQDFAGLSVHDLTDDYMWIVAEKGDDARPRDASDS
jgi:SAM-dependent methyltransferase